MRHRKLEVQSISHRISNVLVHHVHPKRRVVVASLRPQRHEKRLSFAMFARDGIASQLKRRLNSTFSLHHQMWTTCSTCTRRRILTSSNVTPDFSDQYARQIPVEQAPLNVYVRTKHSQSHPGFRIISTRWTHGERCGFTDCIWVAGVESVNAWTLRVARVFELQVAV